MVTRDAAAEAKVSFHIQRIAYDVPRAPGAAVNRPCNIRHVAQPAPLVMPISPRIMLVVSASLLAGVNAMHQNRAPSHTDAHRRSHSSSHTRAWRTHSQCTYLSRVSR